MHLYASAFMFPCMFSVIVTCPSYPNVALPGEEDGAEASARVRPALPLCQLRDEGRCHTKPPPFSPCGALSQAASALVHFPRLCYISMNCAHCTDAAAAFLKLESTLHPPPQDGSFNSSTQPPPKQFLSHCCPGMIYVPILTSQSRNFR